MLKLPFAIKPKHSEETTGCPSYGKPAAIAHIKGTALHPAIRGEVRFYPAERNGCVIQADIEGLPRYHMAIPPNGQPVGPFFAFHIHEKGTCGMDGMSAGGHYNPDHQPHGNHAGDLPVLMAHNGRAFMSVYTDRFSPRDVMGRTVMVHENPDDYRSQPSGNAGARIACGTIEPVHK